MDDIARNEVAECLERLADQPDWNPDVWQQCHDLVKADWDNELLGYVYDDIIHYDGVFHLGNILVFVQSPTATNWSSIGKNSVTSQRRCVQVCH
jgi:hypothetical protein